ncbi:hypothetical protein [Desulfovulcanus sp.]
MNEINWSVLGWQGFRLFGRVSASISHEIKNCLAIINEQNGLLEDFLYLAQQGQPLDIERIRTIAGSITNQIARANNVVQRLNKFAHSIDEVWIQTDLNEIVTLVAEIAQRMASDRGFQLGISTSESIPVVTQPFILMELIFLCVDQIMEKRGKGSQIALSCVRQNQVPTVVISEPVQINDSLIDLASAIEARILVDQLKTKILINKIS